MKNKLQLWFGVAVLVLVIVIPGVWVFNRANRAVADGSLKVVAAENSWGNIAAQIGGSYAQVDSIITDPATDPHLYESNARDAEAVGAATVIIKNGLGYDDFADKLMAASYSPGRQVISAQEVVGASSGDDPHLWYDIPRVKLVAAAIAQQLSASDPGHQADYKRNLQQFDTSLQPILRTVAKIKAKYGHQPVAYTERVPGYLLQNAGLAIKTPSGFASSIEEGNEPNPADTQTMDNLISQHQVKVLLYNSQATSPAAEHLKALAQQTGVPVVTVTETLPTGENFQTWQLDQVKDLLMALGG